MRGFLSVAALAIACCATPAMAQEAVPDEASAEESEAVEAGRVELWQGLEVGMTPEEVVAVLPQIAGIKGGRVVRPKGKEPRIAVRYIDSTLPGVRIGSMMFVVGFKFHGGGLDAILLEIDDVCAATVQPHFDEIVGALEAKYGNMEAAGGEYPDVHRLLHASDLRGERAGAILMRATPTWAVFARLDATYETLKRLPEYGNGKFADGLARAANSMNASRKAECNGRGHQRARVMLSYMARRAYDEILGAAEGTVTKRAQSMADTL